MRKVRERLLKLFNIEIGAGLGPFKGKVWRIGLMGEGSRRENVMLVLNALEQILGAMGPRLRAAGRSQRPTRPTESRVLIPTIEHGNQDRSSIMKIYDFKLAPNPRRVRIYLAEKGLKVPLEEIDIMKGVNRQEQFLRINPLGGIPVLRTRRRPLPGGERRDLPLLRGSSIRSPRCSARERSSARRSRCGIGAWNSRCSCRSGWSGCICTS